MMCCCTRSHDNVSPMLCMSRRGCLQLISGALPSLLLRCSSAHRCRCRRCSALLCANRQDSTREIAILRKYHIQKREDYTKYVGCCVLLCAVVGRLCCGLLDCTGGRCAGHMQINARACARRYRQSHAHVGGTWTSCARMHTHMPREGRKEERREREREREGTHTHNTHTQHTTHTARTTHTTHT